MKFKVICAVILATLLVSFVRLGATSAQRRASGSQQAVSPSVATRASPGYGKLPLAFEANRGQTNAQVRFLARGDGYALFLTGDEAVMRLRRNGEVKESQMATLRMRLLNSNPSPRTEGVERLPGVSNYFLGGDKSHWRTGVESFAKVKYSDVYRGVDLVWYGNQRQLEYDFTIAPGASAEKIALTVDGAQGVELQADGALLLRAGGGEVRMQKPRAWQDVDGRRRKVDCAYRLDGRRVSFRLGGYDRTRPLVIDPVLAYSTFLGGVGFDEARAVAVDAEGNAYVAGSTGSPDFPGGSPIQPNRSSQNDAYVLKINAAGNAIVYATWLGGSGSEVAEAVDVDAAGNVVVTGATSSPDFPLKDALQATRAGGAEVFITKINAAGNGLVYSTLLGGTGNDSTLGVAVDAAGNAYLTGFTESLDFPLANAILPMRAGSTIYMTNNAGGNWSAAGNDVNAAYTYDLAVDFSNPAVIYAATERGVFKTTDGGNAWARVGGQFSLPVSQLVIDPASPSTLYAVATGMVYKSTDGGASWNQSGSLGPVISLAVAAATPTAVYVATLNGPLKSVDGGMTWTPLNIRPVFGGSTADIRSFAADPVTPVTVYAGGREAVYRSTDAGATWQPLVSGLPRGFSYSITELFIGRNNTSTIFAILDEGVLYRTTNGGGNWEAVNIPNLLQQVSAVAIDPSDANVVYVGTTGNGLYKSTDGGRTWTAANNGLNSSTINTLEIANGAPATIYAGTYNGTKAFVTKVNAAGSLLIYSTYLGGGNNDFGGDIAVDADGNAYVVGTTNSKDFPTLNPYQAILKGDYDAFVTKINATGSALVWSTYLGGSAQESGDGIAINSAGNVFISGGTASTDFPTVNPVQANNRSVSPATYDAFVARFGTDGRTLDYSTYLGGRENEFTLTDIAVDAAGNAYVVGSTGSTDFPLVNPAQSTRGGNPQSFSEDAFITKIRADGSVFLYSTYLGGSQGESAIGIAVDTAGNAYVVGTTGSTDFPVTPGALRTTSQPQDGFITKLAISADLAVTINDEPDPVQVNNNLTYRIIVANNGPDAAADAMATVTLPQGVMFVSANASQGNCTGSGPVACTLGNLAALAKATITVVVKPTATGSLTLQANVSSATPDINTANNTASQTTRVSTLLSIFGRVTTASGEGLSGVSVSLIGTQQATITTNSDGYYQFAELPAGSYVVRPALGGYVFNPANHTFSNVANDQRADFAAVSCIFSIAPANRVFQAEGGAGSLTINSPDGQCPWTARSNAAWIRLEGATGGVVSGNGTRTINFTVEPTVGARSGTIIVGGQTFTVLQEFNPCSTVSFDASPVSVLPQAGYFLRQLAADFNNDGVIDLAAINSNVATSQRDISIVIYPRTAAGGFGAPVKALTLQGSNVSLQAFASGELNGDGFADFVAFGGSNQNLIYLVLSNGTGGFAAPKELAAALPLSSIAIADFNSDGKNDAAFGVNSFENNVVVYFNDGAGNLGQPKALPKAGGNFFVSKIEAADFNGDGKTDIVSFANGSEFVVYTNNGAGEFMAQVQTLPTSTGDRAVGDFNGDGRPDILFSLRDGLLLYLNDGGGFGQPLMTSVGYPFINTSAPALVTGDFNGDGKTDAAILPSNATNSVSEGLLLFTATGGGGGNFSPPVWYLPTVGGSATAAGGVFATAADFNGDGLNDLLFSKNNSFNNITNVSIAAGLKSGGLSAARAFQLSTSDSGSQSSPNAIAAADLNGDGVTDLATTNFSSDKVSLLFGDGRGGFGSPVGVAASSGTLDLVIRDFNRDGQLDLAVLSSSPNIITILLGNGRGEFAKGATVNVGPNARRLGVADFNRDGNPDLVAREQGGGLAVWLGNGQGGFAVGATGLGGNLEDFDQTFVVGDFNGDANADLAIADGNQSGAGPQLILLPGNGQGGFGAAIRMRVEGRYNLLSLEDLNADGRGDLLYQYGNFVHVMLSRSDGSFAAPVQYAVGGDVRFASVRDVNGDARPDVLAVSQSADAIYVFMGKGDGSFNPSVVIPAPGLPRQLAAEDFDGDGAVDLAVMRGSSTIGTVLLNRPICPPKGIVTTSAASYARYQAAPESIVALFGADLATTTQVATTVPLPTALAGVSVKVRDAAGVERASPLFFVSPGQINFQIPVGTATGTALLTVLRGSETVSTGTATINRVAPALFAADASGQGFPAAVVLRVKANGAQLFEPVVALDATGKLIGVPVDLSVEGDQVFLLLFGTGIRNNSGVVNVSAKAGSMLVEVQYAGAQGDFVGLDQINLRLPRVLAGLGTAELLLTVDGRAANPLKIIIK